MRSAILRVLTKTSVVRWWRVCSAMESTMSPICPPLITASSSVVGSSIATSRSRLWPQSTITVSWRPGCTPESSRATRSSGRWVAESPMRWSRPPLSVTSASRRSRLKARWLPRLSRASVCTSSTMTVRTPRSSARDEGAVSNRYSDSGVVTRRSGAWRFMAARSAGGVSPVRTATRRPGSGQPSRAASSRISERGTCRFSCTSTASARSGEM